MELRSYVTTGKWVQKPSGKESEIEAAVSAYNPEQAQSLVEDSLRVKGEGFFVHTATNYSGVPQVLLIK